MRNVVHLADCMDVMKNMDDNSIDLCITDPPYGIDINKKQMGGRKTVLPSDKTWDSNIPSKKYFDELFRVSKRQIIWGGNYFPLPKSRYFAIWDKGETMYGRDFAECEYAWVSNGGTRIKKINPVQLQRFHPTQKPVALYKWLLQNYAKPGDKIFDSHVGSGSIRIACHDMGFDFEGCEIDEDYWTAQEARYKNHIAQLELFTFACGKVLN